MWKDGLWSPKGPIKATLQNAEIIIHQRLKEGDAPAERKHILKVELIMTSGKKHILTAYGYYEDEYDDFLRYLKDTKGFLACGSRTIINVNAIELIYRVNSTSFANVPDLDRRKKYGDSFEIQEKL